METQIHLQRQLQLFGHNERWIHGPDPPVEDADEAFEGGGTDGEDVLEAEEEGEVEDVGEEGGEEGETGG